MKHMSKKNTPGGRRSAAQHPVVHASSDPGRLATVAEKANGCGGGCPASPEPEGGEPSIS